ncbi:hypothetical protein HY024_05015 [Candidatus Curtissbacteria bacterium]|nr:hypothetical protein [Candidatus Curtissbacteria bacterium]
MFVVAAIVILIASFVIALFSLVREQKKLNEQFDHEKQKAPESPVEPQVSPKAVEPVVITPPIETVKVAEPITPIADKKIEPLPAQAEPKLEPFPWEVAEEENTTPSPVTEPGLDSSASENVLLHPKRPNSDLGASVSLKDLANKN